MDENRRFTNKDELQVWLESQGVAGKFASQVADQLFQLGFVMPSTLLGVTADQFLQINISTPIAHHLSNKLVQERTSKKFRRTVDKLNLEIHELVVDLLEYPNDHEPPSEPPLVSQDGWLDKIVERVVNLYRKGDAHDGSFRVPITSFARCARGGKTRALLELARALRDRCIPTIFVSFNDFSDCTEEVLEGHSSLDMLCRRIAFDVRPSRLRTTSSFDDFKAFRNYTITTREVSSYLSDKQVVLLIDELNQVELDAHIALFLKKNFLQKPGRYYVFSSHLGSTNPEKAIPSVVSRRNMNIETLPLIQDLSVAKQSLNIPDLTSRMALYFGRIPALLVTHLTADGLSDQLQIFQRTEHACEGISLDFDLFQRVLTSFFTGTALGTSLDVLLDPDGGRNYWIPCYLMELLRRLGHKIGGNFGRFQMQIVEDAKNWSTSKEKSGEGWESLFLLVLWLRYAFGPNRLNAVSFAPDPSFDNVETISTRLFYNYPFPGSSSLSTIKNYQELQSTLNECCMPDYDHWKGRFPKVSIYYPKLANFSEYDMFVCVWKKGGGGSSSSGVSVVTYDFYGYQLTEGKEIPNQNASLPNSYLVRGGQQPAGTTTSEQQRRGWTCVGKSELQTFFGVSGERWLPENWQG